MMRYSFFILFLFLAVIKFHQISCGRKHIANMSPACLKCMCQASTSCNMTIGCTNNYCGAFSISKDYWKDADRPTLRDDDPDRTNAYIDCTKDYECSTTTVINYAAKYIYDCDRNGVTDCEDFARLHWHGKNQCEKPISNLNFGKRFAVCRPGFNSVS